MIHQTARCPVAHRRPLPRRRESEFVPQQTACTASARIASPWSISASVTVRGGSSLITSSLEPAVSTSSPRSKAAADTFLASSPCSKARPRARPRPRDCIWRTGHGLGKRGERVSDAVALGQGGVLQYLVPPVDAQRCRARYERRIDTAEGAAMLAWLPDVQVRADQRERQWQAVAADGLGQADDVRLDVRRPRN